MILNKTETAVSLLKFIFEKINKVIFKKPHFFAIKFFCVCVFIDYFLCSSEKKWRRRCLPRNSLHGGHALVLDDGAVVSCEVVGHRRRQKSGVGRRRMG
jgi:hypothetical protein